MSTPKARILYTEDDPDSCGLIEFVLSQKGYRVTCAVDGTEALALAKNERFDLFLVDKTSCNQIPGENPSEAEERSRLEQESAEQARLQELVNQSKKVSQQFGTFDFEWITGKGSVLFPQPPRTHITATVSDTNISGSEESISATSRFRRSFTIWFADMKDITTDPESIGFRRRAENGSWGNVTWRSSDSSTIANAYRVLSSAHKEWESKFSEVA